MPKRTFPSFEAMFAAHLHADLRGMVLGRDRKPWVMTQLVLNNLSVQWGRPGAGVVTQGATPPGGMTFYLPTQSPLGFSGNGHPLDEFSVMINRSGDEFYVINASSMPWFSAYIPYEALDGAGGNATTLRSLHGFIQVPSPQMLRFRSFIGKFREAADRSPATSSPQLRKKQRSGSWFPRSVTCSPCRAKPNPRSAGSRFRADRSFAALWILSSSMRASICLSNNSPPQPEFLIERFVPRFNNTSAWHPLRGSDSFRTPLNRTSEGSGAGVSAVTHVDRTFKMHGYGVQPYIFVPT